MSHLKAEIHNFILTLTLEGEQSGNSFGPEEAQTLSDTLLNLPKNVKGILFTSASPRFFCTGGNLKFYSQHNNAKPGIIANRKIRKSLELLSKIHIPTIAAVTGDCFGGGMELLSCFDYVISEPHPLFGFWQRKIGLIFGWGGGLRLKKRISENKIKSLAFSTKNISAYEAVQIHLIDQVSAPNKAIEEAMKWLLAQQNLTQAPVPSIKILNEKNETRLFETLWFNREHKEILKKFKDRNENTP